MLTPCPAPGLLNIALWLTHALLAAFFVYAGFTKLATPAAELAQMIPWTAELPSLVLVTGLVDVLGGLGIPLPALARIRPQLTVLAAIGLLALVAFVLWGRTRSMASPTAAHFCDAVSQPNVRLGGQMRS